MVGLYEPTLTAPDTTASVPLAASQELFLEMLPAMFRGDNQPADVITGLTVYPEVGADPEVVAETIRAFALPPSCLSSWPLSLSFVFHSLIPSPSPSLSPSLIPPSHLPPSL